MYGIPLAGKPAGRYPFNKLTNSHKSGKLFRDSGGKGLSREQRRNGGGQGHVPSEF